jgi:hypothetical protein
MEEYIGEVIESSTVQLIAESRELHGAPPFGSFIRVDSKLLVFGVVFNVYTHSVEQNRRPTAYGKTEEELRLEQPQIFELLKTEFQAVIVGYQDGMNGPKQLLPPQPPRIHQFVYQCRPEEVRRFTSSWDYLRTILSVPKIPTDELLIAAVRNALSVRYGETWYLVQTGKEISRLIRNDYDRLSSIIRRISQI